MKDSIFIDLYEKEGRRGRWTVISKKNSKELTKRRMQERELEANRREGVCLSDRRGPLQRNPQQGAGFGQPGRV